MTEDIPPVVPDEAVTAAQRADVERMRRPPRPAVWQSISDARVRVMLEAAAPLIRVPRLTDAEEDRLWQMVAEFDNAVIAIRKALEFAAAETRTEEQGLIVAAAWDGLRVLEGAEEEACDG